MASNKRCSRRHGFTLMELMLALGLTVLVAALIGYLMQMYIAITEAGDQRIKQAQLARSILTTIADDIRSVVRIQPFDAAALEQVLSSSSSGGAGGLPGGAAMGGGASGAIGGGATGGGTTGGGTTGGSVGGSASGSAGGFGGQTGGGAGGMTGGGGGSVGGQSGGTGANSSSNGAGGAGQSSGNAASSGASQLPPGIYGTASSLQIDVSRLPRPDQYFPEQPDMLTGRLTDVPSDTKSVTYTMQAPTTMGVRDPLTNPNGSIGSGGLVRRQLDRAISQWASNAGKLDQLNRTGEILSTEVLEVGYTYYDGTNWLSTWDSSQQGLPSVVEITIAMQDPVMARKNPLQAGISISTMDAPTKASYGIETYSVTVAIPGAQLLSSPKGTQGSNASGSSDSGMGSLGF